MHFTHFVTAGLALAGNALASPSEKRTTIGLSEAMRARGRSWIGTAVTFRDDPKERAIYGNKADFNSITPENAQKWESTEPERGNFTVSCRQSNRISLYCTLMSLACISLQMLIDMSTMPPTMVYRSTVTIWFGTVSFQTG